MTGISFTRDTVVRVRAPMVSDRYGDETRDWGNATTSDVAGCRVQPFSARDSGRENSVDREQVTRRWLLIAPPGADIVASDRIRWGGDDYEVSGEVRRWPSPTGRLAHLEADLVRVEG